MRNERRTSGSGMGAAETCAGNRASAPRPHFHWNRDKKYWRGQYSANDPGLTYPRHRVDVAVKLTPRSHALDEEARLIQALAPRDNVIGQAEELEEAPF